MGNTTWYERFVPFPEIQSKLSTSFELQSIHDPWAAVGDRVLFLLVSFSFLLSVFLLPAFFCVCSFARCFCSEILFSVKPCFYFAGSHFSVIFNCRFLFVPHRIQRVIHGTLPLSGTIRLNFYCDEEIAAWSGSLLQALFSFRLYNSRSISLCQYLF